MFWLSNIGNVRVEKIAVMTQDRYDSGLVVWGILWKLYICPYVIELPPQLGLGIVMITLFLTWHTARCCKTMSIHVSTYSLKHKLRTPFSFQFLVLEHST